MVSKNTMKEEIKLSLFQNNGIQKAMNGKILSGRYIIGLKKVLHILMRKRLAVSSFPTILLQIYTTIRLNENSQIRKIEVPDMSGRIAKVILNIYSNSVTIPRENLASGAYFIRINP